MSYKAQADPDKIRRYITVRGQYKGFHTYADAPDEVAFLRNRHRHLFKWEILIQVFHDDRELEFFLVQELIESKIIPYTTMIDNLGSCEMQAERILHGLVAEYGPDRYIDVTISEDGESDGTVIYDPNS